MKFLRNPGEIGGAMYDLNMQFLGHARREEIEIMLGTCACESALGTFRIQKGGGRARGIMQIEPETAKDLWGRYLPNRRWSLYTKFMQICFGISDPAKFFYPEEEALVDAYLAVYDDVSIVLARAKYLTDPLPIPRDRHDQAAYYKRVYNTAAGGGSIGQYLKAWVDHRCGVIVDMVFSQTGIGEA